MYYKFDCLFFKKKKSVITERTVVCPSKWRGARGD